MLLLQSKLLSGFATKGGIQGGKFNFSNLYCSMKMDENNDFPRVYVCEHTKKAKPKKQSNPQTKVVLIRDCLLL